MGPVCMIHESSWSSMDLMCYQCLTIQPFMARWRDVLMVLMALMAQEWPDHESTHGKVPQRIRF